MTPQEFVLRLQAVSRLFKRDKSNVLLQPMIELEETMKSRIFEKGINSSGRKIGKYGQSWPPIRKERGLQTKYVDLKFSGDLMDSFVADRDEKDSVALGFSDDFNYEKALYQEALQGKKKGGFNSMNIFTPRNVEIRQMQKVALKEIEDEIEKIINVF
jgi:hypothetical protein